MKIQAAIGDREFEVIVERENGFFEITIDGGEPQRVDAHKLEGDFYSILTGGRSYEVSVEPDGDGYHVRHGAATQWVSFSDPSRRAREKGGVAAGPVQIVSQMPGRVVRVLVAEGDTVEENQGVVVVEAMKMENEIASPKAGTVKSVAVSPGDSIDGGGLLLIVE